MQINPNLIARLHAIQHAFANGGAFPRITITNPNETTPAKAAAAAGHWRDALPRDDDEDEGGGRGSARGLRGKDAEHAKRAMRKLTRSR